MTQNNALTTTNNAPSSAAYLRAASAIDRRERAETIQPRTANQYRRALVRAQEAGVNLLDAAGVGDYAAGLASSSRAFFGAAVRLMAQELTAVAKGGATPENIAEVQAAVYRLETLTSAIQHKAVKGTRAHTWLSAEQVAAVISIPDRSTGIGLRDAVALGLLFGAGLRREEAAGLAWSAIHLQGKRVVLEVKGKGAKFRVVPIGRELVDLLNLWRKYSKPDEASSPILRRFYKGEHLGGSLSGAYLWHIALDYTTAAGIPARPHDLRRTYAKIGRLNGVSLEQTRLLLGHGSLATTQIYVGEDVDTAVTTSDFVPLSKTD